MPRTKTASMSADVRVRLLQLALDHLALQRPDEVDEQLAAQVVELVEQAAREQPLALDFELLAVDAEGADPGLHRALDLDEDVGEGEAALIGELGLLAGPDLLGVDEGDRRVVLVPTCEPGLDEEHSGRVADLDGRDPESVLVVHGVA